MLKVAGHISRSSLTIYRSVSCCPNVSKKKLLLIYADKLRQRKMAIFLIVTHILIVLRTVQALSPSDSTGTNNKSPIEFSVAQNPEFRSSLSSSPTKADSLHALPAENPRDYVDRNKISNTPTIDSTRQDTAVVEESMLYASRNYHFDRLFVKDLPPGGYVAPENRLTKFAAGVLLPSFLLGFLINLKILLFLPLVLLKNFFLIKTIKGFILKILPAQLLGRADNTNNNAFLMAGLAQEIYTSIQKFHQAVTEAEVTGW